LGGYVGYPYLGNLAATGDTPITWAVTVGALPDGLSLDANTGAITGTPTTAEVANFTVEATNATGSDTQELSIEITLPPDWEAAGHVGGTAVSATGVMGTIFLEDAEAVPATATRVGGIAHHADGRRYVALWPGSGTPYYRGQIAVRTDGAMLIDPSGAIVSHRGGMGLTYRGEVVVTLDDPQIVHGGFGYRFTGALCVSELA
jgi:hypothetical protein